VRVPPACCGPGKSSCNSLSRSRGTPPRDRQVRVRIPRRAPNPSRPAHDARFQRRAEDLAVAATTSRIATVYKRSVSSQQPVHVEMTQRILSPSAVAALCIVTRTSQPAAAGHQVSICHAWMHFKRSRSRIVMVTLASCRMAGLRTPERGAKHCRNLTPGGHLNLARTDSSTLP